MDNILLEPSASEIAWALEANLQGHVSLYAHLPGAIICYEPGVVGLMTHLDVSESCVYRANFPSDEASRKIGQVLQQYRAQQCLPMWWIVGPSSQPANLGSRLEAHGFQCFARSPGMAVPLENLAEQNLLPDHLVVERVSNSFQLKHWIEIVGAADEISKALQVGFYTVFENLGYGLQATCELFLGIENGRPVAASRLFCAGGVAGIYHVATLPEARGRGYGTAMTLAAAHAGYDRGYRYGVLFATTAGYNLYFRLGFQELFRVDVYKSPEMNNGS